MSETVEKVTLTEAQKAKIERNRQKAIHLKNARLHFNPYERENDDAREVNIIHGGVKRYAMPVALKFQEFNSSRIHSTISAIPRARK